MNRPSNAIPRRSFLAGAAAAVAIGAGEETAAVSYTHLTLPTIYSV